MKSVFALTTILALAGNVRSQFHIHTRPTPTTTQAPHIEGPLSWKGVETAYLREFPSSSSQPWDSVRRQVEDFINNPSTANLNHWIPQTLAAPQATQTTQATQAAQATGEHTDATPLIPLGHEHVEHAAREARASTKALQWIGPIAPNGEVYAYYGGVQV